MSGKTVHALCADGVTPCRFVGYEFKDGKLTYLVKEEGELLIRQGTQVIADEHGTLE